MANEFVQTMADARIDAQSLSEFMFKPAGFMVTRRLAPPINTLNYYLDKFDVVAADANNAISIANNSIGAANAVIADANTKILSADGVVADAYAGAEQRFFDTANNNLNSQIDVYLSAQDIGKSVFDTPQAGVDAGIASGGYYSVRSTDSDYFLEEYKNNAGTPQATGKKYPAAKFLLTKGVFTVSELLILGATATAGARFNTHGFYTKGDCLPSVFEVQTVAVGDVFTDIGNGTLIGNDASIKINSTKKLKLIANESVALSQLGGIKTAQSVTIKNDVIGSVILKNYKRLIIDGFYTLRGTLWHYESNVITGIGKKISGIRMGDNVNKYPIQSVNSNIKAIVLLNDYLEMCNFTLDGNTAKNKARVYTQDINLSYWGFGAALFNINEFYIHDMHVKETEAWGISYNLCNIVHAENITFDQSVEVGLNKDGITGSGKRVTYRNISGYTSDDMCAVGTGKSSLQGVDCGITVNQDIEYIKIYDVEGLAKEGLGTHYAVGIYGADNAKIKSVTIDGITGAFGYGLVRVANYWYISKKLNINSIRISNIAKANVNNPRNNYFLMRLVNIGRLSFDCVDYLKQGDCTDARGGNVLQLDRCYVETLTQEKITIEQLASVQNISLISSGVETIVKDYDFNTIKAVTNEVIVDDNTATTGTFYLVEDMQGTDTNNFNTKNISLGNFKKSGYIKNLRYIYTRAKNTSIDYFEYSSNDANAIYAADGVTIISSKVTIKDSIVYLDVVADITITSISSDKQCFFWGSTGIQPKSNRSAFAPKASGNGANMLFSFRGVVITLVSPSLQGVSATGTYRVYMNSSVSLS